MKLFILKAREPEKKPWVGYDNYTGFVIRTFSAYAARELAARASAGEGEDAWLKPEFSTCRTLKSEGTAGIVISDFNSG